MLNAADNGTGGVQQNAVPNALGTVSPPSLSGFSYKLDTWACGQLGFGSVFLAVLNSPQMHTVAGHWHRSPNALGCPTDVPCIECRSGGVVQVPISVIAVVSSLQPHSSQPNPLAAAASVAAPVVTMENTIMLCACQENEDLPQLAELPADLFTSCLTTPIRTALKWHWMKYNRHFPGGCLLYPSPSFSPSSI